MFRVRTVLIAAAFCAATALSITGSSASAADDWNTDVESALKQAADQRRLAFIKFGAPWCAYCTKMDRTTFVDRDVTQLLEQNFVRIYIDADKHPELVKALKIRGLPACLIVDHDLMILERISGFQSAEKLLPVLQRVVAESNSGQNDLRAPAPSISPVAQPRRTSPPAPAVSQFDQLVSDGQPTLPPWIDNEPGNGGFGADQDNAPAASGFADMGMHAQPAPADQNPFAAHEMSGMKPRQTPQNAPAATASLSRSVSAQPAFQGNCLVSVREKRDLVPGNDQFLVSYRNQVIRFASAEQFEKFQRNPEEYWPVIDGDCAVTLVTENQRQSGVLEYAALFRGRMWLFASEEKMQAFVKAPATYAAAAEEALRR